MMNDHNVGNIDDGSDHEHTPPASPISEVENELSPPMTPVSPVGELEDDQPAPATPNAAPVPAPVTPQAAPAAAPAAPLLHAWAMHPAPRMRFFFAGTRVLFPQIITSIRDNKYTGIGAPILNPAFTHLSRNIDRGVIHVRRGGIVNRNPHLRHLLFDYPIGQFGFVTVTQGQDFGPYIRTRKEFYPGSTREPKRYIQMMEDMRIGPGNVRVSDQAIMRDLMQMGRDPALKVLVTPQQRRAAAQFLGAVAADAFRANDQEEYQSIFMDLLMQRVDEPELDRRDAGYFAMALMRHLVRDPDQDALARFMALFCFAKSARRGRLALRVFHQAMQIMGHIPQDPPEHVEADAEVNHAPGRVDAPEPAPLIAPAGMPIAVLTSTREQKEACVRQFLEQCATKHPSLARVTGDFAEVIANAITPQRPARTSGSLLVSDSEHAGQFFASPPATATVLAAITNSVYADGTPQTPKRSREPLHDTSHGTGDFPPSTPAAGSDASEITSPVQLRRFDDSQTWRNIARTLDFASTVTVSL